MILAIFKHFISTIPAGVFCFFFVCIIIVLAQSGLLLFNRFHLQKRLPVNNEVAGIMFGAISLVYSLILAFVIVAVWEDYEDLDKTIESESDKMNSIITHISTMPDSIRIPVRQAMYTYTTNVINNEWTMHSNDLVTQSSAIPYLRLMLLTRKPKNDLQRNVFVVIDNDLSDITELRRNRLTHNHSQIPDLVWFILKAGTVLLVIFSYFFQLDSIRLKRIYLSFFSGSLAMCLFLIAALDHPFDPRMQISKAPYITIQQALQNDNVIVSN
ncbi:bestrophin-like domain [Flavitalea sp.]|nr:DUF4239 domain-containing protein [Flavitalea sp.]